MSIIHEALKRAESDRTPFVHGVFASRQVPQRCGTWGGMGLTSLLLGGAIGGIGTAIWLMAGDVLPMGRTLEPRAVEIRQDHEGALPETAVVSHASFFDDPPPAEAPSELHELPPMSTDPPLPAVATAPGDALAMFDRAVTAETEGRWDRAAQHYRQSLAMDPTLLKARNNLGNLYIRQNRLPEAVAQLQAGLDLDPEYAFARNNLGTAYLLMGQEAEAIREFLAALRVDSSYVSPYYNLAAIYARRRDLAHALAFLTKAIALEPSVLRWVAEDEDFDAIRSVPAFQQLGRPNHASR